jgi:hypothetical protein
MGNFMKLRLSVICLFMSIHLCGMDKKDTAELEKALAYTKQKKKNEIVLFCMSMQEQKKYSDDPDVQLLGLLMHEPNDLKKKLEAYCAENMTIALVDNLNSDAFSSKKGKTTIYMINRLNLPINHNDGDLYHIRNRVNQLKEEEQQSPFVIATTEKGMKNLYGCLSREYPDHTIISFPEQVSFFRSPLVIVGGMVALIGFWWLWFKK